MGSDNGQSEGDVHGMSFVMHLLLDRSREASRLSFVIARIGGGEWRRDGGGRNVGEAEEQCRWGTCGEIECATS